MTECPVPWTTSPPLAPVQPVYAQDSPESVALSAAVATVIGLASDTTKRSLQQSLGASQIGRPCDRQVAYQLAGVPAVNRPDPLRAIVGTGLHLWLHQAYSRLNGGSGRYLLEQFVEYRGIPGSADCFDRFNHAVIDFKSSTLKKIADFKRQGVPPEYATQVHLYGCALADRGENVERVALVFIPIDGTLHDIWSWAVPLDRINANAAVDRVERLRGTAPATVSCSPSRLCGWCGWYSPGSTDLAIACSGRKDS